MARELEKIGLPDSPENRQYIARILEKAFEQSGVTQPNGRVLREALVMGPGGQAVRLQSVWEGERLITVIVKGAIK